MKKVKKVVGVKFQFPSNGKDFPNGIGIIDMSAIGTVSIPFKREGLSEQVLFYLQRNSFLVSIPFKREGLSELEGYLCLTKKG